MFYYASKIAWFFTTPSNLLLGLALAGLVLAATGRLRRWGFALAFTGLIGALGAGLGPVGNWLILPLEERFPAFLDDGRAVHGVVVLGGALEADESVARGQAVLNEAGERLIALADLARHYPGARLVVSGGGGTVIESGLAEAVAVRRFAGSLGVVPERLILEDRSRTTAENASQTRRLVEPKPGERWLLVTSAYHMPRAVGSFRQAGFPVTAYPVDFRTRGPQDRARSFAFASEGLRRTDISAREWAGLLAYRLSGRTDALFPEP